MTFKGRDAKADVASRKGNRGDPSPSEPRSPAAAKPGPPSEAMAALEFLHEFAHHNPSDAHFLGEDDCGPYWRKARDTIRALEARVKELKAALEWLNDWCDENLSAPLSDDPELSWAQDAARAALREKP